MDLHLHTPGSNDYQNPEASYLDVLLQAELRGLDIIAFADHNTVAGYRKMYEEIEELEFLEQRDRLTEEEETRLSEYRRLLDKILVLPGFEFTATFGFHILGIFSKSTSVREIEHLLLNLNIPPEELDKGSSTVGATSDVLTAYRMINEAGGLVIAAHANSSNGVAMRGFPFGGQTKIAYTQDPNLHALEVTDLDRKGRRSTAAFFSGTKPEYPRRMHCIQGSDAHRLRMDPNNKKNLGVGDRATRVLLDEVSFDALMRLFKSNDFARHQPFFPTSEEMMDFVQQAREEGPSIVQDFHESMTVRGGRLYSIIADVCSFANTNGGTLYIGADRDAAKLPNGIDNPNKAIQKLRNEISKRISPQLDVEIDTMDSRSKKIIRIMVPRGDDPPYAVDDNKIYVRDEADTGLAVRDEIVQLVLRGGSAEDSQQARSVATGDGLSAPKTGVEIVEVEERQGTKYYTLRDLRNGNVVNNVTQSSARRLWDYAIREYRKLPDDKNKIDVNWKGEIGVLNEQQRGNRKRWDLVQRTNGKTRFYYGVTEDGVHGAWKDLVGAED
ncbi:MAG: RNA-binding domain-containing protein [Anaerolineales bacterium]